MILQLIYLLSSLGFQWVWVNQGVGNKSNCIAEFKQRLTDNFIQNWNSRLQESSRAILYALFSNFDFQLYLDSIKVSKFRTAISELRMSSHRLEIEVGRWARPQRTPVDQRKYRICNKLEDEFHFLFECILYTKIREKYIKKYYWRRPNMIKMQELMRSNNRKILLNLAIYTEKTFKIKIPSLISKEVLLLLFYQLSFSFIIIQ